MKAQFYGTDGAFIPAIPHKYGTSLGSVSSGISADKPRYGKKRY
ncbi:MAG: hypothetical protein V1701_08990 [Planctomycetota bacterium]